MQEQVGENISYKPSDTYTRPNGPFNESYARACEINFGMSRAGAERHYQLMLQVPEGYSYHGIVPAEKDLSVYPRETIVIATEVYDLDGNPMPGHVAIAMKQE